MLLFILELAGKYSKYCIYLWYIIMHCNNSRFRIILFVSFKAQTVSCVHRNLNSSAVSFKMMQNSLEFFGTCIQLSLAHFIYVRPWKPKKAWHFVHVSIRHRQLTEIWRLSICVAYVYCYLFRLISNIKKK